MAKISPYAVATAIALATNVDAFVGPSPAVKSSSLGMSAYPTSADDILWTPSWKTGERDEINGPLGKYCEDLYSVTRRKTRTVTCGPIKFGSDHPIVRQTMATTDTANVEASIEQIIRCADEGFDLVRITVQGKREANAAAKIREGLFKRGYDIPLCADMHFQPVVAQLVADAVEKIRINPGKIFAFLYPKISIGACVLEPITALSRLVSSRIMETPPAVWLSLRLSLLIFAAVRISTTSSFP